ncbi:MAG TPA: DUF4124 domain-containing protein [Gammaproteobacteria bacterium]
MKMLISMVLTLGIVLFASQYMLKGMGGIPGFGGASESASSGLNNLGNALRDEDVTVYQWTDAQGVTHYGSTPPTGQGSYEVKLIQANANLMQAHKSPAEEEEADTQRPKVAKVGTLYTPEGVKGMMDDASDLQEQMNKRVEEQEKMMQDLMHPASKK